MTAVAGWYPDPGAAGQLRYWDGQAWTSSTATAEQPPVAPAFSAPPPTTVAQPAYGQQPTFNAQPSYGQPASSQPGYPVTAQQWGSAPVTNGHRRKRIFAVVGVVVVVAVIATVVPLATGGDSHGPSEAQLTKALLSADEVGGITNGNFTAGPVPADDDDSNSKADCNDSVKPQAGAEKADVNRMFTGAPQFAQEDLSYTLGAASLFTKLKAQLAGCHSLTIDGNKLALTPMKIAAITGADDTLAVVASGTLPSGVPIAIEIAAARFGNTVVEITYGEPSTSSDDVADITNQLLQGAATKAKSVF